MLANNPQPFSIEDLFQHKAIEPLPPAIVSELERIRKLNTTGFKEVDVRAYVIDPIVRLLGYEKGTSFSPDLEKKVDFLDKRKFIDYKCTLWQENFWIIEAKRPLAGATRSSFGYEEFHQALEYAVHPQINAALLVLCDGELFEVFDREENVIDPVLRFRKDELLGNFDKLRTLLGPWQVWFFEKRRVIRLIDKVFDREFNLQRLDEFRRTVEDRLVGKRAIVQKNYQERFNARTDAKEQEAHLRNESTEDLIDAYFFFDIPYVQVLTIIDTLVTRCRENPFPVLFKMFPDRPREANDHFYVRALTFLITLHEKTKATGWKPGWLPNWLCNPPKGEVDLEYAVQVLLSRCLTQFAEDEARKVTLLCYAAVRRVLKSALVQDQSAWTKAEGMHAFLRYAGQEMSWDSFVSSPGGQALQMLNSNGLAMTVRLINSCKAESGELQIETAKVKLRELWAIEKNFLHGAPQYRKLLCEREISEGGYVSESIDVDTDYLGHLTLCYLEHIPVWREYALTFHRDAIEDLVSLGSWQAPKWLEDGVQIRLLSNEDIANRFFYGDVATMEALQEGYQLGKNV
ncbi:MAG: hypothetical protein WDN23_04650 [Edaphobacter sp.]